MALATGAELMRAAVAAATTGITRGGGPFGALVVDAGGAVLAVAANVVLVTNDPTAHAEVQAIRMATARRRDRSLRDCTLITTCAPCVMCTGAIHWAGVSHVIAGARSEDAESIGFVEGPRGFDPAAFFAARGVTYTADVERDAAVALLRAYPGVVYNG